MIKPAGVKDLALCPIPGCQSSVAMVPLQLSQESPTWYTAHHCLWMCHSRGSSYSRHGLHLVYICILNTWHSAQYPSHLINNDEMNEDMSQDILETSSLIINNNRNSYCLFEVMILSALQLLSGPNKRMDLHVLAGAQKWEWWLLLSDRQWRDSYSHFTQQEPGPWANIWQSQDLAQFKDLCSFYTMILLTRFLQPLL